MSGTIRRVIQFQCSLRQSVNTQNVMVTTKASPSRRHSAHCANRRYVMRTRNKPSDQLCALCTNYRSRVLLILFQSLQPTCARSLDSLVHCVSPRNVSVIFFEMHSVLANTRCGCAILICSLIMNIYSWFTRYTIGKTPMGSESFQAINVARSEF